MSKRKKYPQRKTKQQQRPRPPRDAEELGLQELERRLNAVQQDAVRQHDSGSPFYEVPWRLMGRLVVVGTPVTADSGEFILGLKQFGEILPSCAAKDVISMAFNEDHPGFDFERSLDVVHTLYRHARWEAFSCPAISVDSGLAVSAMLTSYPREFLDDFVPPWDAFVIRLPAGLIEFDGVTYTDVMVHRYDSPVPPPIDDEVPSDVRPLVEKAERFMAQRPRERWGLYGLSGERGHLQGESQLIEHLGLVRREHFVKPLIPDGEPSEGVMNLFARLVAGVCALANPASTRRTSPDDSPTVEWQLLSRPAQDSTELEALKAYLKRLKTVGYAMPPTKLGLEELRAWYGIDPDAAAGAEPNL